MAQRHYKGEPRRPDGESMLMLCSMIFIYEPIFLTTAHFLFDSTVFEWFTVAMIAGIVAILHYLSNGRIYPFSRREAVMQHYEGRRFSPFRCYFFLFSTGSALRPSIRISVLGNRYISAIIRKPRENRKK